MQSESAASATDRSKVTTHILSDSKGRPSLSDLIAHIVGEDYRYDGGEDRTKKAKMALLDPSWHNTKPYSNHGTCTLGRVELGKTSVLCVVQASDDKIVTEPLLCDLKASFNLILTGDAISAIAEEQSQKPLPVRALLERGTSFVHSGLKVIDWVNSWEKITSTFSCASPGEDAGVFKLMTQGEECEVVNKLYNTDLGTPSLNLSIDVGTGAHEVQVRPEVLLQYSPPQVGHHIMSLGAEEQATFSDFFSGLNVHEKCIGDELVSHEAHNTPISRKPVVQVETGTIG